MGRLNSRPPTAKACPTRPRRPVPCRGTQVLLRWYFQTQILQSSPSPWARQKICHLTTRPPFQSPSRATPEVSDVVRIPAASPGPRAEPPRRPPGPRTPAAKHRPELRAAAAHQRQRVRTEKLLLFPTALSPHWAGTPAGLSPARSRPARPHTRRYPRSYNSDRTSSHPNTALTSASAAF